MPYPVTFRADYVEKRSRLTTFFRLILAIPHIFVVFFYLLAAEIVVFFAWFALLFTGRYPQGMYDFVAGALRYGTRICGYVFLLTDEYPPFSGDPAIAYPVDLNIAPPKAEYSRLKVFFRIILLIPVYIISYAMQIVAQVGALLAWFAIVILGRQPKGLQDMTALGVSYQQRAYGYFFLLTEDWPPFTDDTGGRTVEAAPAFGALPSTPPAAGPEHPTSVPPGGYASPEREAAFPAAPAPAEPVTRPVDEPPVSTAPPVDEPPASEAPTEVGRPAPETPPAAAPEPTPEPPSEPGPAAPSSGDPLGGGGPSAPTSGDPLGGTASPAPPEPEAEPSPPSPGDWPDPPQESGPPSPGDWPDPEPEPEPTPEPERRDDDEDEPPPGPFGPSSTNP